VRSQSGAAFERKIIIPELRNSTPSAGRDRRIANKSGRRRLNSSAPKEVHRTLPINHNDSGGIDPTKSSQRADLAFQHAMRCAIAQGLERPPTIGVVKDIRPLNVPRLFEPVPHSSGCTSPALECAELMAHTDWLAGRPESPIKVNTRNTEGSDLCGPDAVIAADK